jgi:hypothetical protein
MVWNSQFGTCVALLKGVKAKEWASPMFERKRAIFLGWDRLSERRMRSRRRTDRSRSRRAVRANCKPRRVPDSYCVIVSRTPTLASMSLLSALHAILARFERGNVGARSCCTGGTISARKGKRVGKALLALMYAAREAGSARSCIVRYPRPPALVGNWAMRRAVSVREGLFDKPRTTFRRAES